MRIAARSGLTLSSMHLATLRLLDLVADDADDDVVRHKGAGGHQVLRLLANLSMQRSGEGQVDRLIRTINKKHCKRRRLGKSLTPVCLCLCVLYLSLSMPLV